MVKNIRVVVLVGLIACGSVANAVNYVGLDYKYRNMLGHNTNSYNLKNVFKKNYSGADIYYTFKGDNNVGLNFGLEESAKAKRNYTFAANEKFLAHNQHVGDRSYTETQIKAAHLDVCGYYNFSSNFEAIGQLGYALMQAKIRGTLISSGVTSDLAPSNTWRLIPRIGIGLQYFMQKHFGVRALVNWEGTNMYRISMVDSDGVRRSVRPFRQSWTLAVGIVGKF